MVTEADKHSSWENCNNWFRAVTERCFGLIGYHIASHPSLTIVLSLTVIGALACGFIRYKPEDRTEKLFIPQDSKAIRDLESASKHFPYLNNRQELLLFVNKTGGNVLTRECMDDALTVHNAVTTLPGYTKYCVLRQGASARNDSVKQCIMLNPMEIFDFDSHNLVNISERLSAAYNKTMQNGRPGYLNYPRIFGEMKWSSGILISADAIQIEYIMQSPADEKDMNEVKDFEKEFINKVSSLKSKLSCMNVYYITERSLDDAISESTGQDILLFSITFILMSSFACTMLGKFRNPLTGHSQLANAGLLAVSLGIAGGLGLSMAVGMPFISLVGVLPFLVVGIGIDDMFIIVDEMDRQDKNLSVVETMRSVMGHCGNTVTMTTVTDLVAFAVSTSTAFPSIRIFCVYAALSITFSYLMMVTFFVAIATFDLKRIRANRRDCLPLCVAPPPKEGEAAWDEPRPKMKNKVMRLWGKFLMKNPVRVTVILLSLGLIGVSVYGATYTSESFDRRLLAKDGSYFEDFITAQEKHYDINLPVTMVMDKPLKYEAEDVQADVIKLSEIASSNKHYIDSTVNWMESFTMFARKMNWTITGKVRFMQYLKVFITIPEYSYFGEYIALSQDNTSVVASRVSCYMKDSSSSTFQKDAMVTLRSDLAEKVPDLSCYPISRFFIYFEQYALIQSETIRNLVIAAIAVLLITWPFLLSITATLLVVLGFTALIVELFALMAVWNVSLNSISMINLVMAIGFSVDYSAHIAHAFVTSSEPTPELRVEHALSTLGASVIMGGISTFLGMVVLAFAASEIFQIFFRMFFGMVVLGLLHGVCFLPVYMSLICRWDVIKEVHSESEMADRTAYINATLEKTEEDKTQPLANPWVMSLMQVNVSEKVTNGALHNQTMAEDKATNGALDIPTMAEDKATDGALDSQTMAEDKEEEASAKVRPEKELEKRSTFQPSDETAVRVTRF